MRGHVRKRGNRWAYVLDVEPGPSGRRRQKWVGGFRTRKEADRALAEAVVRRQEGAYVEPTKQTVGEFLGEWIPAIRTTIRSSTWESYERNVRLHIRPGLGAIPLRSLTPAHLNTLYAALRDRGSKRAAGGGLSPRTIRYIHVIIHRALRDAVRWGRLARNVADLADPPAVVRQKMTVWSPEQLRRFLERAASDRLHAAFVLLVTTGMRRGEVAGLRWEDVDLDEQRVSVQTSHVVVRYRIQSESPKTDRSRRFLQLDGFTVVALRAHRKRQLEERFAAGRYWNDTGLAFTREDGSGIHPERISATFLRLSQAAGLPKIRLHDLRHSYATAALRAGIPAKVVSERLGHASIAITLDTYSHVTPEMDREAANKVAAVIFGTPGEPAFGTGVCNSFANEPLEQGKQPKKGPAGPIIGEEGKRL
jgi:integrase